VMNGDLGWTCTSLEGVGDFGFVTINEAFFSDSKYRG